MSTFTYKEIYEPILEYFPKDFTFFNNTWSLDNSSLKIEDLVLNLHIPILKEDFKDDIAYEIDLEKCCITVDTKIRSDQENVYLALALSTLLISDHYEWKHNDQFKTYQREVYLLFLHLILPSILLDYLKECYVENSLESRLTF